MAAFQALTSLLSYDDWIYTGILLVSVIASLFVKPSQTSILRGGIIGFVMAVLILRAKILYSMVLVVIVLSSHAVLPRKHLTLSVFVVTFVYLMILRSIHLLIDVEELASHANVVQLIITLRVIGITFEISDTKSTKKEENKNKRYLEEIPDIAHQLAYFYHFCGLFTGPYYTYQMLRDSTNPILAHWDPTDEILHRMKRLLWSVPLFIAMSKMFPLDGLRTDAVWDMHFYERLVYAAAVFVVFRARVYSAWAVAESICVFLKIGIYPSESKPRIVVGPTDMEAFDRLKDAPAAPMNADAIVNLDIPNVEISDGFREGIRSWNRSVQSWLALYVHSRVGRAYRVELTMFVSALWHGTYAGYFMSFLIVPMCTTAEDILFRLVPIDEVTGKRPAWFRYLYIFTLRSRGFDMLATGFLLKNFHDTHRFWSSLYYWLLAVTLPIYIIDKIYQSQTKSDSRKEKKAEKNN